MSIFDKFFKEKSNSNLSDLDYNTEFNRLWNKLVPKEGQAETVQGEMVRAIGRMSDEYFRNGYANWGSGYSILSNFLKKNLSDGSFGPTTSEEIQKDINAIQSYGLGEEVNYDLEKAHERLTKATVMWCEKHPEPIHHLKNEELKM